MWEYKVKEKPLSSLSSLGGSASSPRMFSGLSRNDPGFSAYDIKRRYPDFPDGFYWITGHLGQPVPVWCHMTDTGNGFGWMLIATAQGNGSASNGNAASSSIHTRNAVGEIDLNTGTIPTAYKIADADINFWTSNARPQLDHPKLVNIPVFAAGVTDIVPANKSVWYDLVDDWFIPDTNWTNGEIDFRGKNTGTFSNRGYDTYSQYFFNTNLNNNSYLSGTYTGWGPTLFESYNQWGSGIIWGATSSGGFYRSGWRTNGFLFYRAG